MEGRQVTFGEASVFRLHYPRSNGTQGLLTGALCIRGCGANVASSPCLFRVLRLSSSFCDWLNYDTLTRSTLMQMIHPEVTGIWDNKTASRTLLLDTLGAIVSISLCMGDVLLSINPQEPSCSCPRWEEIIS